MGVTLDELLDRVGIGSGEQGHEKTASQTSHEDENDLVSALRKCAEDDMANVMAEAQRELIEKTAEISVVKTTLEEIDSILQAQTPEEDMRKVAAFIRVALDRGYSQKNIALHLKTAGISDRMMRWLARRTQGAKDAVGREGQNIANRAERSRNRLSLNTMVRGTQEEQKRYLRGLEATHGKNYVATHLKDLEANTGTRLTYEAKKYLPRAKGNPSGQTYKFTDAKGVVHEMGKEKAHTIAKGTGLVAAGGVGAKALSKGDGGGGRNGKTTKIYT